MQRREYLNLPTELGPKFYLRKEALNDIYDELEDFLALDNNMNNLHFAKKMLFSHEIKANNQVEGYSDDLAVIESVIKKQTDSIKDKKIRQRILNLYRGYQYILNHRKVDKHQLQNLYNILSKDLLEERDLKRMGDYYRQAPVYILQNNRLDIELSEGVGFEKIAEYMDYYFAFFNENKNTNNMTDEYIKSQILHFYFVYIHPYFDVNGRSSRTMALWHLLNKKAYPYIIFNRGISFAGSNYDRIICKAKKTFDITYFLQFMLETVKTELEKESVMQQISANSSYKLTGSDYQTILYFLTMNGLKTAGDFVHFYNQLNDKKRSNKIYEEMLCPLIDNDILQVVRYTNKILSNNLQNMVLEFNSQIVPNEEEMHLKRLKVFQSSKK